MAYFQLGSNWRHTQILQMQLYTPGNNTHGILINLPQSCTFFAIDSDLIEGKKSLILTSNSLFFHHLQSMNLYASSCKLNTGSYITEIFSFQRVIQGLVH